MTLRTEVSTAWIAAMAILFMAGLLAIESVGLLIRENPVITMIVAIVLIALTQRITENIPG